MSTIDSRGHTQRVGFIAFGLMLLFYAAFFTFLMYSSKLTSSRIAAPLSRLAIDTGQLRDRIGQDHFNAPPTGIAEIDDLRNNFTLMAEELGELYGELDAKVRSRTEELEKAQIQLVKQEKLASIGQLAAGVAHEINNPMAFVSSNVALFKDYFEKLLKYINLLKAIDGSSSRLDTITSEIESLQGDVEFITAEIPAMVSETLDGVSRVRRIVAELRTFARTTHNMELTDLNHGVSSVVGVLSTEIKQRIETKLLLGDLPLVRCNASEVNQVFMNIIANAYQAIPDKGHITVTTWTEGGFIKVSIADSGTGMDEATQKRLFEPFFTTKAVGKGMGLGLSVSFDIVKKHKGDISVQSRLGEGSTFTITLPVENENEEVAPPAAIT